MSQLSVKIGKNYEIIEVSNFNIPTFYYVVRNSKGVNGQKIRERIQGVLVYVGDFEYTLIFYSGSRKLDITTYSDSRSLVKMLDIIYQSELGRNISDWFDLLFFTGYISSSNLLQIFIERWGIEELSNDLKWLEEKNIINCNDLINKLKKKTS